MLQRRLYTFLSIPVFLLLYSFTAVVVLLVLLFTSLRRLLEILLKVPKGAHVGHKKVNYSTTDHVMVDFGKEVPFHVDGEVFRSSTFDVKIHPGKIPVIYHPEGNHYFRF